jgi:hypothetical protein
MPFVSYHNKKMLEFIVKYDVFLFKKNWQIYILSPMIKYKENSLMGKGGVRLI